MNDLTFQSYVEALTQELGSHYKFVTIRTDFWLGFIYCECYYGKDFSGFNWWNESSDKPKIDLTIVHRPWLGVGAVARIELEKVVILDHRLSHNKDKSTREYFQDGCSDSYKIHMSQPDFHEQFLKIQKFHDEMTQYFDAKMEVHAQTSA